MNETLKKIAWWCNVSLCFVLCILELVSLIISSLVMILLSPFFAFVHTNNCKLKYPNSKSWWVIYKNALIRFCTDELPIVVFYNHF